MLIFKILLFVYLACGVAWNIAIERERGRSATVREFVLVLLFWLPVIVSGLIRERRG